MSIPKIKKIKMEMKMFKFDMVIIFGKCVWRCESGLSDH